METDRIITIRLKPKQFKLIQWGAETMDLQLTTYIKHIVLKHTRELKEGNINTQDDI